MGRNLKRVPLDFKWQIDQIWKGYISPYSSLDCKACDGSGYSEEYKKLQDRWYGNDKPCDWVWCDDTHNRRWNRASWNNNIDKEDIEALLEAGRLWDFTRIPLTEEHRKLIKERMATGKHNSWLPFDNGKIPTPAEVNEWNKNGMGHDSSNAWIIIEAKLKKLGLPDTCEHCGGEGVFWFSEEIKELAENFERIDPPKGEGYQLWEDTSEGSPNSPVFKTLEELCEWCEKNTYTFADCRASKEDWFKMLKDDNVCHKEGNVTFM